MPILVDDNGISHFKDRMIQRIDEGDSLSENLTVELGSNGSLGGYKTGDFIEKSTPLETIIKKLLAKQVPPTYTAPAISIANNGGDPAGSYEYGSIVTPKVRATFRKNDGGSLTSIKINKGTTEVASSTTSPLDYVEPEQITLIDTVTFTAKCSFNEGAIKNDNFGDPYSTGHIAAGSKTSNDYSFTIYRQGYFWGVLDSASKDVTLTSDIIRSCHMKNGGYKAEEVTGITAAEVANRKRIFVACPASEVGLTKVIMPSAMNANCTSFFKKQADTIIVESANGATGVAYNVWIYEPASISNDQTFTVTLG